MRRTGEQRKLEKKKLLSIVLCGVLLISQLGTSVFALDHVGEDSDSSVVQKTENRDVTTSSDENNGQESVDSSEAQNQSTDTDENIQPNAGAETTDPAGTSTDSAVKPTDPEIDTTGSAVETTGSAVETTGSAVETTGPAVETTGSAVETTGPAVDTTGSAVELTGPAMELTGSAIGITGPAVEPTMPALLLLQLPIDTPVRISDYPVDEEYNPERNYIIQDESDLRKLAELVNGTAKKSNGETITVNFSGATITVEPPDGGKVIDLTSPWIPIGISSSNSFQGTFNGNNVRIGRLQLSEEIGENSSRGLFGEVKNATIKNLTVGGGFSSDLKGYNVGTGGIVGHVTGNCVFENCINQVQITGTAQYAGGIVGFVDDYYGTASFTNCRNEGEITGGAGVGGVVGQLRFRSGLLSKCVNQGTVSGTSNVGGIAGYVSSGEATMEQCQNNKARIEGSTAIGGILGQEYSGYGGPSVSLNRCENSGEVSAKSKQAGGLVGVFPKGTIEDSFVTGSVVCGGSNTGGIVGQGNSSQTIITRCFYYNQEQPLKIAGNSLGKVTECYYLQADQYGSSYGGEPKSAESFQGKEVAYFLNGQETHKTTWSQGTNYPELDGNQKVVYRVQIAPYGTDSKSEIMLDPAYHGYVSEDVSGGKNLFLYEGESVSFTVKGSGDDSVTVQAEPSAALTQQEGTYTIRVSDSDVSVLYGTSGDFESPTIAWYSPQKTVFTLTKENELIGLRMLVSGDTPYGAVNFSGKTIQLGADITLKQSWTPISTSANPFSGTFDGKQMHITGLKIGSQEAPKAEGNQGFFGELDQNSKVCNLNLEGQVYSNGDYVGGIVGSGKGVIQNCSFDGTIQGGDCTGGIAGYNNNSSSNALTNKASVTGKSNVGGIFGKVDADFGDKSAMNQNSGTITGTGDNIGGLAGYASKQVSYGKNSGDVNGDGSCTGGLVGYAGSIMHDCQSNAAVTGKNKVGGLVGSGAGKTSSVSAEGTVSGIDTAGGLVGELSSGSLSAFSVTTQTEGTSNIGVIVGSCPNKTVITNGFYYKISQSPGGSEDHATGNASGTTENHTTGNASETSEDTTAVETSGSPADHAAMEVSEASEDHTAMETSEIPVDHTTVEAPENTDESPMWAGAGQPDLSQFYFLASAENDQGGRTAEQFASGEVGWLLDGGEKPESSPDWTQEKGEPYPKAGNAAIYRIRLTAENPLDTANNLKIDGGIAEAQSAPPGVQTIYAGKGSALSFIITSQDQEEINFLPAIDLTKENAATLKMLVSGNYEGTYRFTVIVAPSYDWLKNPEDIGDGHHRYKLATESDLVGLSNLVNGTDLTNSKQEKPLDFSGDTVELTKDVAMKIGNWIPIGSGDTAFCGTFDGTDHSISGMKNSSVADNQGFFGSIRNAAIKNLTLSGSVDGSGQYLGGIVGRANGNCILENLTFGSSEAKSYVKGTGNVVGGVLGGAEPISSSPEPENTQEPSSDQKLTLIHCVNLGDAEGKDSIGGVAGQLSGSSSFSIALENCENRGKVTGAGRDTGGVAGRCGAFVSLKDCVNGAAGAVNGGGDSTGGVSGYFDVSVSAEGCSNAGVVQGQGKYAGGIAGYGSASVKIKNCKNDLTGKVHGTGDATGGIVGSQASGFSEITGCSNLGIVDGQGKSTGGVAGEASDDKKAVMTGNFNAGTVSGRNNTGGIVGSSAVAELSSCWNEGNVSTTSGYAGGVVGEVTQKEIRISSCYNTGTITGTGGAGAVGGITGSNHAYSDSVGGAGTVPKADSSVTNCYNSGITTCSGGTAGSITGLNYITNINCYAQNNTGIDRKFVDPVTEEQIKSGELAYRLDRGGETPRTTDWSQGDQGPVIAADTHSSIYKLSVNVSGGGTIKDGEGTVISKSKVYFVKDGQSFSFTAVPDQGQKLFRVKQNGETVAVSGSNIGVLLSSQDVTLSVVFAGEEIPESAILVSFDANGGLFLDGAAIATVIVDPEKDGVADIPENPVKEKADFDGWYTDAEKGEPAPKPIKPKKDVTYFAHWNENIGLFSKGDGSKDNPYEITSAADLELMADVVNSGKEGYGAAYYKVAEGIGTLTADASHTPIGNTVHPFMGVFNGNGVTIELAGSDGLFGIISNSEFYNFTVDARLSGGLIGAVANYMTGKGDRKTAHFDGITVNGSVKGSSFTGGILGGTDDQRQAQGWGSKDLVQLIHCRNNAEIHGGGSGVGGLVGFLYADHEIQDCVNTGNVTGTGQQTGLYRDSFVGGMAGWFNIGTVNRCANIGNITGTHGMAGGILGGVEYDSYTGSRSLKNCYNTGNIKGAEYIGGICGDYVGGEAKVNEIENCYNYGTVTADNASSVGDINSESMRDMKNCYVLQDVATDGEDSSKVTPMSKESFASGEVAYLLDGGESDHNGVWTQDWQNGYPSLGQPSIYQLKVTGNEGLYTATVTAGGKTLQIKDGGSKEDYAGGGDKPVTVSVHCDSKTVSKDGKRFKVTYEVESIAVNQEGESTDITSSKRFNMNANSEITIAVTSKEEELQPEKPVPPTEEEQGNGHGSGHGDGDGNGTGSHGNGNGQGVGDQGNGDGLGQGSGTAAGNQSGEGDVAGNSQGGSKDQSATAPSKATVSSEKDTKTSPASQQNQPVSPEPLISSAQPAPNQKTQDQADQDQGVQTANSGGLESGSSSGFGDKKTEPDKKDKVKVFEIIKQTVSENPWTSAVIVLLILAIAVTAALRRYKNNRKN